MARQGQAHHRGGGGLQGGGGRAQRHALLLTVHPLERHRPPHPRLHYLSPLHPATAPRRLRHQLVRVGEGGGMGGGGAAESKGCVRRVATQNEKEKGVYVREREGLVLLGTA